MARPTRSSACLRCWSGRGFCSRLKCAQMHDVVLAPGLWVPSAAMALLATRLGRAGYVTHVYAYRGRSPFEVNVERFARFAQATLGGRPAHFIGHSLGGVLVLDMLNRHPAAALSSPA